MSAEVAVPETGNTAVATMPDIAALQAASDYASPKEFVGIAGAGFSFLPRLQLFTSNSDEVKRGAIGVAEYGIISGKESTLKKLGKTVLVVPLAWRAKAMVVKDVEKPLAYHKPQSPEFKAIRAKADADSNSGNMYGPEYLMWCPGEGYVTFFMGSKTARNAATPVRALLPKPNGSLRAGILNSVFIEAKGYSWHGPTISPSDQSFEGPPVETLLDTITSFLNPTDSVPEDSTPAPADAANTDR